MSQSTENSGDTTEVVIWDLPTRIFHWLLTISFAVGWITHENDRFLFQHVYAGYLFIGLLIFRFVWGMVGSQYARFRSFAYDWPSVTAYIKGLLTGSAARHIGHNPAGSWAIFLMLVLGLVITISGLLVLGGEEGHGPLKGIISFDMGSASKELHEGAASFMLFVVAIHFLGVIIESYIHQENLIWSMITGRKPAQPDIKGVQLYPLIAVLMLSAVSTSALYYFHGYIIETEDQPFLAFKHDPLPMNDTWLSECSDCHLAFHPSLLPARSWHVIFEQQEDHFGDDLALDPETIDELLNYARENASEKGATEPAHKITRSVPKDKAPIRITEIDYWKDQHHEIDEKYWRSNKVNSKANCPACHLDAEQGWFEDSNMRLPKLDKK